VALFQNGFVVDDGPLRKYDEAESQRFLGAIMQQCVDFSVDLKHTICRYTDFFPRQIPHELTVKHRGAEIDLHLENRKTDEYVPPKVSMQPFSGHGYMLGRFEFRLNL